MDVFVYITDETRVGVSLLRSGVDDDFGIPESL